MGVSCRARRLTLLSATALTSRSRALMQGFRSYSALFLRCFDSRRVRQMGVAKELAIAAATKGTPIQAGGASGRNQSQSHQRQPRADARHTQPHAALRSPR